MEKQMVLDMIEKEMGQIPPVLQYLSDLDFEIGMDNLKTHLSDKKKAYSGDALGQKTKSLVALGVGIALDSPSCIITNIKAAKKNGATPKEIMEAFKVAKFSKSSTVLSSSELGLKWLVNNL